VHERTEAIALIHDAGRCYGAIVRNLITGELVAYVAKATCIASGGAGRIYRVTTNAVISEGTGSGLALETGIATLGNMEAVQFHPTGIFPAGILVTEGCRGDGGLLKDVDGHRFMPDYEPEKKELASRDVVSRRMEEHIAKGKGAKSRFGDHIWLDITLLGEKHIKHNLREVFEICHYFLGVDPTKEWIPYGRPSITRWAACAPTTPAKARRSRACSRRARRPAGTCTASIGWAATRSPRRWWQE
jgi:fumarate reductase flavoprotein subunit